MKKMEKMTVAVKVTAALKRALKVTGLIFNVMSQSHMANKEVINTCKLLQIVTL